MLYMAEHSLVGTLVLPLADGGHIAAPRGLFSLEEPNLVGGGIEQQYLASHTVRLDAGAHERVVLATQLGVRGLDIVDDDEDH